jgi:hypothetical protein
VWYGKYCSYWRFGITNCPHLQSRNIRRPEGVKLQWHEERAGNCELASGITGTKRRRDSLGTVRKPCLRRQRDKHQKHNTHMSQCLEISFPPKKNNHLLSIREEITPTWNLKDVNLKEAVRFHSTVCWDMTLCAWIETYERLGRI